MAVKIRMKKMGSRKKPFYRIVAADSRSPRDGRFIEALGYYNPLTEPPDVKFDEDKVYKWLDCGAEPTDNVKQILRKAGLLERWRLLRKGVKISELDARIEEMREKQPKPKPKAEKKKVSKKKAAAGPPAEEEKKPEEQEKAEAAETEEPEEPKAEAKEAEKPEEPKAEAKEAEKSAKTKAPAKPDEKKGAKGKSAKEADESKGK